MLTHRRDPTTLAGRLPTLALAAALPLALLAACGDGDRPDRTVAGDRVPQERQELPPPTPDVRGLTAHAPDGGRADVSAETREKPVRRPPLPEPVTYAAAESVYHAGDHGEAVRYFEAYVERRPDNPWGRYMLGLSAWKADRDERAVEALEAALERDPDHLKSRLNLGRVLLELERPEAAREHVDRALAVDPRAPGVLRVAGNVALELGETDRAKKLYRRALEVDGTDAWSMNNLGLVLLREGRYREALPPLARAVELRPGTPTFRNNLGAALERTGHPALAAESYGVAFEAGHGPAGLSLERVRPHVSSGEPDTMRLDELARRFARVLEDRRPPLAIERRAELRHRRTGGDTAASADTAGREAVSEAPAEEPDIGEPGGPDR